MEEYREHVNRDIKKQKNIYIESNTIMNRERKESGRENVKERWKRGRGIRRDKNNRKWMKSKGKKRKERTNRQK